MNFPLEYNWNSLKNALNTEKNTDGKENTNNVNTKYRLTPANWMVNRDTKNLTRSILFPSDRTI